MEIAGIERLFLSRGRNMLVFRQMGEEGLDLSDTHFSRMAFVVIENIATSSENIGFLCAVGIMLQADRVLELIEKFFRFWRGCIGHRCLILQS